MLRTEWYAVQEKYARDLLEHNTKFGIFDIFTPEATPAPSPRIPRGPPPTMSSGSTGHGTGESHAVDTSAQKLPVKPQEWEKIVEFNLYSPEFILLFDFESMSQFGSPVPCLDVCESVLCDFFF